MLSRNGEFSVLKITFAHFNKFHVHVGLHDALHWPENNILQAKTELIILTTVNTNTQAHPIIYYLASQYI